MTVLWCKVRFSFGGTPTNRLQICPTSRDPFTWLLPNSNSVLVSGALPLTQLSWRMQICGIEDGCVLPDFFPRLLLSRDESTLCCMHLWVLGSNCTSTLHAGWFLASCKLSMKPTWGTRGLGRHKLWITPWNKGARHPAGRDFENLRIDYDWGSYKNNNQSVVLHVKEQRVDVLKPAQL